jgi:GT2 family glycosyltransferase
LISNLEFRIHMDISIVIPTWRGRHLLEAYLPSVIAASDSYRQARNAETEIVVVEDAGGDDTPEWLKHHYGDRVRLLEHEQNLGFCSACQTGFEHARYPVVLLLNNDVRLDPACIAPFVEHFSDPGVFAVTGKMFNQKGDMCCNGGKIGRFRRGMWSSYQNYDAPPQLQKEAPTDGYLSFAAIAAFSAYDRQKFLKIGGLDQLTAMYEDIEISYRAWKRGWKVKYEPRCVAYHDASQTMNRRYRKRSLDRLSRRSRILMHWILLHDPKMFGQHVAFIAARILTSWIWLDWPFYWAVWTGLRHIAAIRRKRADNRQHALRSDREILLMFEDFLRTTRIEVF